MVANNRTIVAPPKPVNSGNQRFHSRNANRPQSAICGFMQNVTANKLPLSADRFASAKYKETMIRLIATTLGLPFRIPTYVGQKNRQQLAANSFV
jgi:hypothetical protein